MTQPMNPGTNLPMSLQVDKMQQIRQTRPEQLQAHLARRLDRINDEKQTRVISNQEAENEKISEDESSGGGGGSLRQGEENQDGKEKKRRRNDGKGRFVDFTI